MNTFYIPSLLASKEFKEKQKMSWHSLYIDFKENCSVKKKITEWKKNKNEYMIILYCLEDNINVKEETELLNKLYKRHGL